MEESTKYVFYYVVVGPSTYVGEVSDGEVRTYGTERCWERVTTILCTVPPLGLMVSSVATGGVVVECEEIVILCKVDRAFRRCSAAWTGCRLRHLKLRNFPPAGASAWLAT